MPDCTDLLYRLFHIAECSGGLFVSHLKRLVMWLVDSAIDILLILYNCVFVIDLCIFVVYIFRIPRLDRW